MGTINGVGDLVSQSRANLRPVSITNGFDEQIAKGPTVELQLAEYVKHLATERLTGLLQFFEQRPIDIAFPGFVGNKVPQMTDFRLTDSVDASEALLQSIGVPREILVDHQVRALKVDALCSGVGGNQNLNVGVVQEALLTSASILAPQSAMYLDNCIRSSEERTDLAHQVVERVAVFGEDNQLLPR